MVDTINSQECIELGLNRWIIFGGSSKKTQRWLRISERHIRKLKFVVISVGVLLLKILARPLVSIPDVHERTTIFHFIDLIQGSLVDKHTLATISRQ
jgi:hypothetical protein